MAIVPLILTCERDLGVTTQFAASYRALGGRVPRPVVVVDQSAGPRLSGEYLALVSSLQPRAVYVHPAEPDMSVYDSVQVAANFALEMALRESSEGDYILFMEDDIIFSTRFADKVNSLYLGPETGFVTLYKPGGEYGQSDVVEPERFYGTQCIMFTRRAVEDMTEHRESMMRNFWPGYDIRWSRFLASRGFVLYATDYSYVQHLASISRLHGGGTHRSDQFVA